jgi:uncharacterized protein (DUF2336 family)
MANFGFAALDTLQGVRDRMLDNPSSAARATTAALVADEFVAGTMGERERAVALTILEDLARDTETEVRAALAEHVKNCSFLPAFLARTLAEDVARVAIPIIRYSPVLTDADLLAIVAQGNTAKQVAAAERDNVSEQLSEALAATGKKSVIRSLMGNSSAELSERVLAHSLDRFGRDKDMQQLIVERPLLPLTISERLIRVVSDALRERLVDRHGVPRELAEELAGQAGEEVLTRRVAAERAILDVELLAMRLYSRGKLTPTLMLRALLRGDDQFFEAAMAMLGHISIENAALLIFDRGRRGFEALYRKAGLPDGLFPAFRVSIDFIAEIKIAKRQGWRLEHTRALLARISSVFGGKVPSELEAIVGRLERRSENGPSGSPRLH